MTSAILCGHFRMKNCSFWTHQRRCLQGQAFMKMLMGLFGCAAAKRVQIFAHNIKDKSLVWYDWKSAPRGQPTTTFKQLKTEHESIFINFRLLSSPQKIGNFLKLESKLEIQGKFVKCQAVQGYQTTLYKLVLKVKCSEFQI